MSRVIVQRRGAREGGAVRFTSTSTRLLRSVCAQGTRLEIQAAASASDGVDVRAWREALMYGESIRADVFAFTRDKTGG